MCEGMGGKKERITVLVSLKIKKRTRHCSVALFKVATLITICIS